MLISRSKRINNILKQADAARDRKDWTAAAEKYSSYLKTSKGRAKADIWVQLGHALKESGKHSEALEAYKHAATLAPETAEIRLQLGHLFKVMGRRDEALTAYQLAQQLDPTFSDAQEEIRHLQEKGLVSISATSVTALRALAYEASDDKDWTAASVFYEAYLTRDQTDSEAWFDLGRAYKALGKETKAYDSVKNAVKFAPNNPLFVLELGKSELANGRNVSAAEAFSTAIRLDSKLQEARDELQKLVHINAAAVPTLSQQENSSVVDRVQVVRIREELKSYQNQVGDHFELLRYRDRIKLELLTARRQLSRLSIEAWSQWQSGELETQGKTPQLPHIRVAQLREQLSSSALFDATWYADRYCLPEGTSALDHFCSVGSVKNLSPNFLFDLDWYTRCSGYSVSSGLTAIEHYLSRSPALRSSTHPLFDLVWYRERMSDPGAAHIDLLEHFLTWGDLEARSSHPLFDPTWYSAHAGSTRRDFSGALQDYLNNPSEWLNSTHVLFDAIYYLSNSQSALESGLAPLMYYVLYEDVSQVSPHPAFDCRWYLTSHGDVASHTVRALEHFAVNGIVEARSPGPGFPARAFKKLNSTGQEQPLETLDRLIYGTVDDLLRGSPWANNIRMPEGAQSGLQDTPDLFNVTQRQVQARIAVVIYVFYPDLWEELAESASRIPEKFDLFVILTAGQSSHLEEQIKCSHVQASILTFPNRGRDIFSFVALLNAGILFKYELICKLHTKKSPHRENGSEWRRQLTSGLLKDVASISKIISAFDADSNLAIVVADGNISGEDNSEWAGNAGHVGQLCHALGLPGPDPSSRFPAGSIYWIRPWFLRPLAALKLKLPAFEEEPLALDGTMAHGIERLIGLLVQNAGMTMLESGVLTEGKSEISTSKHSADWKRVTANVHQVAFYLPQFHPIPENNIWWGEGFTEWTNVTKASPQFVGHRQPRLPAEFGFYDLRLNEVRVAQSNLAKRYGLSAFCYYHYWFDGKTLLEKPINDLMTTPEADLPFFLCWANEPWTRSWDGNSADVLLPQTYPTGWETKFAANVARYMRDPRYFRLNGLPVLFIYRVTHIPALESSLAMLRSALRNEGVGEVHIGGALVSFADDLSLPEEPTLLGLDSYFGFPPHKLPLSECVITGTQYEYSKDFEGQVFDYERLVRSLEKSLFPSAERVFPGVMMGWDNTARRGPNANIFTGANPCNFRRWLAKSMASERCTAERTGQDRMVLINAWNEWAEGTYLEPDQTFGRGWLEAILSASGRLLTSD